MYYINPRGRLLTSYYTCIRSSGGSLMGMMFWNAALGSTPDDGYNIYLDGGSGRRKILQSRAPITANTEGLGPFL